MLEDDEPMDTEIHIHNFSRSPSTLYRLQGDNVDWYTGFTGDRGQILVIKNFPDVLVIRFAHDGNIDGVVPVSGFPSTSAGFFSEQDEEVLGEWLSQAGFQPGLIQVKSFFLSEHHIGISDLSSFFKNILLNPTKYSQAERAFAQRELSRWSKEGLFEFSLGEHNELWIDKTGQIIAS